MNMCQKGVIFGLTCGFIAGLAIGSVVYGKRGRRRHG